MSVPILTVDQMREWEAATWKSGQTEDAVIARVGGVIAKRIQQQFPEETRILILAGKGNNGNDARQACPHLGDFEVELLEIEDPAKKISNVKASLAQQPDLIVDALFGIGLNRPLNQKWRQLIETVNSSKAFVLSIDSPSGLNCETGQTEGAAVRADLTLTLGAPKTGLLVRAAWPFVGRLEVAPEIGLVDCGANSALQWTVPGDFDLLIPRRSADSHKGSYGHLVIFAGSVGYHGAAVLAARAAQSAAPGLITVVTTEKAYESVAAQLQSAMVRPWCRKWQIPKNTTAVAFGPGLAGDDLPSAMQKRAISIWKNAKYPVVADASGLDWLSNKNSKPPGTRVITPHPGEAARLLEKASSKVQADRVGTVRRLSRKLGNALVILKGHQTIVGSAKGRLFFNGTGSPRLAQGGSGDVLTGYLGGLLAQPSLQTEPSLVARYAVWRHGLAGESVQWNGWIENLPMELAGSAG